MSLRCDEYNGVCVITTEGDLAGDVAAEARRICDERLSRPDAASFVFDLGRCEFIDSAGLEMLCSVRRRCDEAGKHIALARPGPNCARILELTRLAARFDCHADLTGAVSAAR
jgi:anti-anti-sigma factor